MPSDVRLPPSRSYPQLSRWPVRARLISLLLLLYGLRHVSLFLLPAYKARQQRGKGAFGLPIGIVQSLGPYSPWYAVEEYVPWGPDCELTQVNILQRHGARWPTEGANELIETAVRKLQSASSYRDPALNFLRTYKHDFGADDLTSYGIQEARMSARDVFVRYRDLIDFAYDHAYVRASSSRRVVDSADVFIQELKSLGRSSRLRVEGPFVVDDEPTSNNTLCAHMCLNADLSYAANASAEWSRTEAPPIFNRLNVLAPGANLTAKDVAALISLCGFHSVSISTASPFCRLFLLSEYEAFERLATAGKYYSNGFGNPLGRVQGVGYVNELLGRLASRKVRDHTQTNASHPFPLRRPLYADFTHDTLLASVLSALDLIPRDVKDWKISTMTPFAGRLVFERAQCDGDLGYTQRVRALLNDRVRGEWKSVEEFRETQDYAVDGGEGDWEKCGWKPADGAYGEVEEEVLDEFL